MKNKLSTVYPIFWILMLLLTAVRTLPAQGLSERIYFVDAEHGRSLLTTRDEYTNRWSWFDVHARLGKKGHPAELLEFAGDQALDWTEEETGRITHIMNSLTNNIAQRGYALNYPDSILLVKSTCREEGGAEAYTRGNYIVFKSGFLRSSYNHTRKVVAHELFHVLSRSDSLMRKKLYALIGFQMCNEIDLPRELNRRRITNPDAPFNNTFIHLMAFGDSVQCMMHLYSDKAYSGGSFFNYLNLGFLQISGAPGQKTVVLQEGKPVLFNPDEVEGFYEQVGRNTKYIIHPEEILADNFVYAVQGIEGVASPEIIEGMSRVLSAQD